MIKRSLLFVATIFLILLTIYLAIQLFNLNDFLRLHNITYFNLTLIAIAWGSVGALLSLALSQFMTIITLKIKIIRPRFATVDEIKLVKIAHHYARRADLKHMPAVGVYISPEVNAFATGTSRHHALIAISSGLLTHMPGSEIEGVLAHEVAHIANGDMVTLTLLQGIRNAFVLFLTAIISYGISLALTYRQDKKQNTWIIQLSNRILTILFVSLTCLGNVIVNAFSRQKAFTADANSAKLVGRDAMIATLRRLQLASELEDDKHSLLNTFKITQRSHWVTLFSTHPTLEKRIHYLMQTL